jgi:hypothetical protein
MAASDQETIRYGEMDRDAFIQLSILKSESANGRTYLRPLKFYRYTRAEMLALNNRLRAKM